jgi:radical SAM protein with 4Fe4S-binding SPASM domain
MEYNKFPKRVTVELTNRCNLQCSFCPRNLVDMKLGNIDEALYYKIIDELAENLPICLVIFFRGESLLHPKLPEFIRYAKLKGLEPIQLASNGYALDDKLGEAIIQSGLDFISFSLDTINEDIYKSTRKNGDLKTSINNVINFIKKCEKLKEKGIKVPEIQVSTVDVEDYRKEKKDFVNFWTKYADKVRVYVEHSSDGNMGSMKNKNINIVRKPCKKVFEEMVIYWNGDIALCCFDWNNQYNIGNVKEKSIKYLWNSEKYYEIRNMHIINNYNKSIACRGCDQWEMFYNNEGFIGETYFK